MAKKILIIDDDRSLLKMAGSYLEAHGYEVACSLDGDEALTAIKANAPDLIVLDVQMPKMNGYTFLFELKKIENAQKIPVIVLTAKEGMAEIFKLEGVKEYITKPLQTETLLTLIKKHI